MAGRLTLWFDRRYRPPTVTAEPDAVQVFPMPRMLKISALSVIAAWASILAVVVGVLAAKIGLPPTDFISRAVLGTVMLFFGLAVLHGSTAWMLQCPRCTRRLLVQTTSRPPFGERMLGVTGWAAIVLQVVVRRPFRCMLCGQRFTAL